MTTKTTPPDFIVVLKDDDGTAHPITVTVESLGEDGSMREIASEIVRMARKNLASRSIDYDRYRSDSQYADDLDRLADTYVLVEMHKEGPKTTYAVDATYSDNTGPWGDDVQAVDEDEAEFQAAWQMNLNAALMPSSESFLDNLTGHDIHSVEPAKIRIDDLAREVAELITRYRRSEPITAEINTLAGMIARLGFTPDTVTVPPLATAA